MARTRRTRAGERVKPGAEPIDVERIVLTAVDLLDESGLSGLTMRNLADRLDIQAATLYWYVQDKAELMGLVAEAVCREIRPPKSNSPWRQRLKALMSEYRRVLLAHRDAAHVLAATIPAGPHRLRLVEIALHAVVDAGFDGARAVRAGRLLVDYTTGFVQDEYVVAARASGTDSAPVTDHSPRRALPTLAEVQAQEFPTIASLRTSLRESDSDARFRFGLEVILDGLEQRRPEGARSGSRRAMPTPTP